MPRVPRLGPQMPGIAPVRAGPQLPTVPTGMSGLGDTVERAGVEVANAIGQIDRARRQHQAELDVAAAKNADTAFQSHVSDLGFGQNGYYRSTGADAVHGLDPYMANVQKAKDTALQGLSQGARQIVEPTIDEQIVREHAAALRFQAKETRAYADSASVGRQSQAELTAQNHANDPQVVAQSIKVIRSEVADRGQRAGLAQEDIAAHQAEAVGNFAAGLVAHSLQVDPAQAVAAMDHYGELIPAPLRDKLEPRLQAAEAEVTAGTILNANLPLDQQVKLAKQTADPKVRRLVAERIRQNAELDALVKKKAQDAATEAAIAGVRSGQITRASQIPADLSPENFSRVNSILSDLSRGRQPQTAPGMYSWMLGLTPQQLAAVNPSEYADKFSKADYKLFVDRRDAALKAQAKPGVPDGALVAEAKRLFRARGQTKFDGVNADPEQSKAFDEVLRGARGQLEALGRPATMKDVQDALDSEVKSVVTGREAAFHGLFGWGKATAPAYQVQQPGFEPGWPPPDAEAQIRSALEDAGRPVTDANIQKLWSAHVLQEGGAGPSAQKAAPQPASVPPAPAAPIPAGTQAGR